MKDVMKVIWIDRKAEEDCSYRLDLFYESENLAEEYFKKPLDDAININNWESTVIKAQDGLLEDKARWFAKTYKHTKEFNIKIQQDVYIKNAKLAFTQDGEYIDGNMKMKNIEISFVNSRCSRKK